jgi:hypothetical protein
MASQDFAPLSGSLPLNLRAPTQPNATTLEPAVKFQLRGFARTQKLSLVKLGDRNPFAAAFCVHSSGRFVTTEYRLHEVAAVGKRLDRIVEADVMQYLSWHPECRSGRDRTTLRPGKPD